MKAEDIKRQIIVGVVVGLVTTGTLWAFGLLKGVRIELSVPRGSIVAWDTSLPIPDGWILCDGDYQTPKLTGRFLLGASKKDLGSNEDMDGGTLDPKHVIDGQAEDEGIPVDISKVSKVRATSMNHKHRINEESKFPPYYKVAFIMKK